MSPDIEFLKEEEKEKMQPMHQSAPCELSEKNQWMVGAGLILFGSFILVAQLVGVAVRFWPLFILFIGLMALINGLRYFVGGHGRFSSQARGGFVWGGIMMVLGFAFLFGWSIGAVWPAFLIVIGFGALFAGIFG